MKNLRKYGNSPFTVVVVHGGPGAAGEMAPVAHVLADGRGVLEPLQTEASLKGQIEELKTALEEHGDLPVILVGFSWGAWLSFLLAAHYPPLVKKLILIGSGGYEEKYAEIIMETRLNRLTKEERVEVKSFIDVLNNPTIEDKNRAFARFGALFTKADAYDPMTTESESIVYQADIFQSVWKDAAKLRRSGLLLKFGTQIKCPVVAVHGDTDPHPAEGVQKPLSAVLDNFRFILLKNCGHRPWIEREAGKKFYQILQEELCE